MDEYGKAAATYKFYTLQKELDRRTKRGTEPAPAFLAKYWKSRADTIRAAREDYGKYTEEDVADAEQKAAAWAEKARAGRKKARA